MSKKINHNKGQLKYYSKRKVICAFAVLLLAFIFSGCTSQGTETQYDNTFPKTIYKVGEEGTSGNWNMKVLDVSETNTVQSGDISYKVTTNENFIVVTLQMKNIAGYTTMYTSREFLLRKINSEAVYNINNTSFNAMAAANGKEKVYSENSNFIGVNDEVGSGITKKTYIIFEVPKGTSAADYMLINKNDNGVPTGFSLK